MGRPLRIEYPGAWYHVMNRGRRREKIYEYDEDYQIFIDLLKESAVQFKVRISAYCLMRNHYHLIINTPEGNLSRCMRHINGIYTQKYNRLRKADGPIFRGRYKSILISEDRYLLELVKYIHCNPLTAHIVDKIEDYRWSSHRGYLEDGQQWNWLYKDIIMGLLSNSKKRYKDFIEEIPDREIIKKMQSKKSPLILGSEKFIEEIRMKVYGKEKAKRLLKKTILAPKQEEIVSAVCDYYDKSLEEIFKIRRGYANEARDVAIYLMKELRGDNLLEIGKYFNLEKHSSVSSAIGRIKRAKRGDIRKKLNHLNDIILKRQT